MLAQLLHILYQDSIFIHFEIFSGPAFVSCIITFVLIGISFECKVQTFLPAVTQKGLLILSKLLVVVYINHLTGLPVFKAIEYQKIDILLVSNMSIARLIFYFCKIKCVLIEVALSFGLQFIVFLQNRNKNIYPS